MVAGKAFTISAAVAGNGGIDIEQFNHVGAPLHRIDPKDIDINKGGGKGDIAFFDRARLGVG